MHNIILILGPVSFQNFEIPSRIVFGGQQRLAIHRLPGGARIIDAMGRDDSEISFSGIFSGEDATLRARALDELRALGAQLPLTWDVFFYSVVIKSFSVGYEANNWIPFHITCAVLRDEAATVIEAVASLATSVLSDISVASGSALSLGIGLIFAQKALAGPGATTRGTAAYAEVSARLAGARKEISADIHTAEIALDPERLFVPGDPLTGATVLDANANSMEQLASLAVADAYVGRAKASIENAST